MIVRPAASASGGLEHGTLGEDAMGYVTPEGDEQLAGEGHDGDAAVARGGGLSPPLGQGRVWLVASPAPGELDHDGAQGRIAGLGDALLIDDLTAAPGGGGEPGGDGTQTGRGTIPTTSPTARPPR